MRAAFCVTAIASVLPVPGITAKSTIRSNAPDCKNGARVGEQHDGVGVEETVDVGPGVRPTVGQGEQTTWGFSSPPPNAPAAQRVTARETRKPPPPAAPRTYRRRASDRLRNWSRSLRITILPDDTRRRLEAYWNNHRIASAELAGRRVPRYPAFGGTRHERMRKRGSHANAEIPRHATDFGRRRDYLLAPPRELGMTDREC